MWDLLLPQTELTLKLLSQANLYPSRSSWSYFHKPFNYDATPIRTLGCDILAHMRTRSLSILRPMHHPQEDRPPASPPRVVIPKPPATPQIPIASQDEPIACRTRSRFPCMDCAPPRANKTIDTAPIDRCTRSRYVRIIV